MSPSMNGEEQQEALENEQTPLISNGKAPDNGTVDGGRAPAEDSDGEEDIPIAEEPTTAKLLLVLGSIWLGCFLAALDSTVRGFCTCSSSASFLITFILADRNALCPDIYFFRLLLALFLARLCILCGKRSASTTVRQADRHLLSTHRLAVLELVLCRGQSHLRSCNHRMAYDTRPSGCWHGRRRLDCSVYHCRL